MATLIFTVIFGLALAYFATQNTALITLNFLNYTISGVATYVAVVGALLIGLFLSWIISIINDIGTSFTLAGKENKIKDYKKEIDELTKQNHQLELENTRLQAETNIPPDDKSL